MAYFQIRVYIEKCIMTTSGDLSGVGDIKDKLKKHERLDESIDPFLVENKSGIDGFYTA